MLSQDVQLQEELDMKAYISLFKVTKRKGQFYVKWRENIVAVLRKYREFDKEFKKRIESGDIFICERHYAPSQIEYTGE